MTEFSDEKKVMEVKLVVKCRHVSINALNKIWKQRQWWNKRKRI